MSGDNGSLVIVDFVLVLVVVVVIRVSIYERLCAHVCVHERRRVCASSDTLFSLLYTHTRGLHCISMGKNHTPSTPTYPHYLYYSY